MPRAKRLLYDKAIFHIVQRGHNKDRIFKTDNDYIAFKETIRKYKKKFAFSLYHYCLMPNHIHMLIQVEKGDELPKIIQGITQTYSYYYRKKYTCSGYVYQNRYKSFHIESDSYLLECGRYIERNPLRACIVRNISDYIWSSYNFYANGDFDDIITENPLYAELGKTPQERKASYQRYILETRPYEKLIDKVIVG